MPDFKKIAPAITPRTRKASSRGVGLRLFTVALLPALLIGTLLRALRPHTLLSTVDRVGGQISSSSAPPAEDDATGGAVEVQGSLSLSAKGAVLMNGSTGEVYHAKRADLRLPMASTTKIMTALVVIESIHDLSQSVSVHPGAVNIEGSSVYLSAGERISVEALLYALLLESANDAAAALAYAVAGSIPAFADKMNARAAEIGLSDTCFVNPHGLYDDGHYTTAYELGRIMVEAMRHEQFRKIVSTRRITIPGENGERLMINHNRLLSMYPGCVGGKTGYTLRSGRCLVSAAEREGLLLVAVTLSAPDDWKDHKALHDYGFSLYSSVPLPNVDTLSFTLPVFNGCESTVTVAYDRTRSKGYTEAITLPRDHGEIVLTVELPRFLWGEIREGDTVGYAVYRYKGEIIEKIPLTATASVAPIAYRLHLLRRIAALFSGESRP